MLCQLVILHVVVLVSPSNEPAPPGPSQQQSSGEKFEHHEGLLPSSETIVQSCRPSGIHNEKLSFQTQTQSGRAHPPPELDDDPSQHGQLLTSIVMVAISCRPRYGQTTTPEPAGKQIVASCVVIVNSHVSGSKPELIPVSTVICCPAHGGHVDCDDPPDDALDPPDDKSDDDSDDKSEENPDDRSDDADEPPDDCVELDSDDDKLMDDALEDLLDEFDDDKLLDDALDDLLDEFDDELLDEFEDDSLIEIDDSLSHSGDET